MADNGLRLLLVRKALKTGILSPESTIKLHWEGARYHGAPRPGRAVTELSLADGLELKGLCTNCIDQARIDNIQLWRVADAVLMAEILDAHDEIPADLERALEAYKVLSQLETLGQFDTLKGILNEKVSRKRAQLEKAVATNKRQLDLEVQDYLIRKPLRDMGRKWLEIEGSKDILEEARQKLVKAAQESPRRIIVRRPLGNLDESESLNNLLRALYHVKDGIYVLPYAYKASQGLGVDFILTEETPTPAQIEVTAKLLQDGGIYTDLQSAWEAGRKL